MSLAGYSLEAAWHHRKAAIPIAIASVVLPPRRLPERPIFLIGCPRSGTTIFFRLLRRLPGLTSIGAEGHALWETFHHPRGHGWRSSALGAEDVGRIERRYVAWAIAILSGDGRFVDKTPRNVLRLPYLDAMFPDATFVYVYRDGRAIVASLYERWTAKGERRVQRVPRGFAVAGLQDRVWRFVLPEGWQAMNGRPLEEVCAFQYVSALEAMLEFREHLAPQRLLEVRYEDLCKASASVLGDLAAQLGVATSVDDIARASADVRPEPAEPRWVRREREITAVLPTIRPMLDRTGYSPETR